MIRVILPALALAGTVVALPAAAQNNRAALLAQVRAEFAATDLDRDGFLTRAEVAARIDRMKVAGAAHPLTRQQASQITRLWFDNADANHDGRVTLAESEAMATQLFDRYDTNRDGVISPAERAAARRAMTPKR